MIVDEMKDIEILERDLKVKEKQETEHFGMVSLGILAQKEILRLIKLKIDGGN